MGRAEGFIPPTQVVDDAAEPRRWGRRVPATAARPDSYRTQARDLRSAFTLFELLVVLLVIGILGAIAVPQYASSVGRYRVESAARRVAADLNLARAKAKAASATRSVTFNPVAATYTIGGARHLDRSSEPYTVDLGGPPYHVTLTADFGGVPQAQFDMYGAPIWSGLVIVRAGDYQRTVRVVKENGSITVN